MEDENFYQVQGWMLNRLKLSGNDLIVYAIIYGFSQDKKTKFFGSLSYLEKATNSSRNSVISSIKVLLYNKLIIKESQSINGVTFNHYFVNTKFTTDKESIESIKKLDKDGIEKKRRGSAKSELPIQKVNNGSAKSERGVVQDLKGGSAKSEPNNITYNKEDNIDNNIVEFPVPSRTDIGTGSGIEDVEIVEEQKKSTVTEIEEPSTIKKSEPKSVAGGAAEIHETQSPFAIEEITAEFKQLGCNGQSESYANEFFWAWQNKNWEVSAGNRMKNLGYYAKKFLEAKTTKELKKSGIVKAHKAHTPIKEAFLDFYKMKFGREFKNFNSGDAKSINEIITKLEKEMKEKRRNDGFEVQTIDPIETVNAFKFILQNSKDEFVNSKLSLKLLNSKFDDVINSIRQNSNSNKSKNNGNSKKQSSEDFRAEFNAIVDTYHRNKQ